MKLLREVVLFLIIGTVAVVTAPFWLTLAVVVLALALHYWYVTFLVFILVAVVAWPTVKLQSTTASEPKIDNCPKAWNMEVMHRTRDGYLTKMMVFVELDAPMLTNADHDEVCNDLKAIAGGAISTRTFDQLAGLQPNKAAFDDANENITWPRKLVKFVYSNPQKVIDMPMEEPTAVNA